jgi:hypothetical protein
MQSTFVSSSNIDRIGWERGRLFVRFRSGASYKYDAPYPAYALLEAAEREQGSVGKTFHKFVRTAYPYEKLLNDPFERGTHA